MNLLYTLIRQQNLRPIWVFIFPFFIQSNAFGTNENPTSSQTLTCPPNEVVGPLFGECGIYLNFNTLVWHSTTGVASHSFSVLPTHFFTYGTSNVTLTVTDTTGQVSSCSFSVTVNPPPFTFDCYPQIIVGFDGECEREITSLDVVDGFRACDEQYEISILDASGNDLGNVLDTSFVGPAWNYLITDTYTENTCYGVIVVDGNTMNIEATCPEPYTIFCHESYDSTGVPIVDGCFGQEEYTHTYIDNKVETYCDGDNIAFTIFRTWTSEDPFGNSSSCEQVINAKRVDINDIVFPLNFDGIQQPVLSCSSSPNLEEVADTSITGVPLFLGLDPSTVPCSITFIMSDEVTNVCGNHFIIERTWEVLDYCEDVSVFHTQTIIVEDDSAPVFAVPDTFFLSTLTQCGTTFLVPYIDLIDECSDYNLLIETPWQTHDSDNVISQFAKVPGTYNMTYTATDDCGNESVEAATIIVGQGVIAHCPENPTISSDYYKDNLEESINLGNFSVLNEFGGPQYYANCTFNPLIGVQVDIDDCYIGEIIRTFTVNVNGNNHVCVQTITVEHVTDLAVAAIPSSEYYCQGNEYEISLPVVENVTTEEVSISFSDIIINDPTYCYKVVRTWEIENVCDPSFNLQVNQEVNVFDTIKPVFSIGCPLQDVCIIGENCYTDIVLPMPEIDDCSGPITFETSIFLNNIWLSDPIAFTDAQKGTYDIRFVATDRCHNKTTCLTTVKVVDCQPPTANCEDVVLANIQIPNPPATQGSVTVTTNHLNNLSYDNCTGVLNYSFSQNSHTPNKVFNCDDVGINPTILWVTDENGNKDSCSTVVVVTDDFEVCEGDPASIGGNVSTEDLEGINDVEIENSLGLSITTDMDGNYSFPPSADPPFSITPIKDVDHDNGVTTFDLVLLTKHVLGVTPLGSPYKIIAADANRSNSVTTFDAVQIRRLILGVFSEFPDNTSWRFIDADYVFPNPSNPFAEAFPETINVNNNPPANEIYDFIGIKIGDLNGSASTVFNGNIEERFNPEVLILQVDQQMLLYGKEVKVPFTINQSDLLGLQFAVKYDQQRLTLKGIEYGIFKNENIAISNGVIKTSWNADEAISLSNQMPLFSLVFDPMEHVSLENALSLSKNGFRNEGYTGELEIHAVELDFNTSEVPVSAFKLFQNRPNPFSDNTVIGFSQPQEGNVSFTFYTPDGKVILEIADYYPKGYSELNLQASLLKTKGLILYQAASSTGISQGKMVIF